MKKTLSIYALGHFAVDFCCAWLLLGRLTASPQWAELALVYNFCAFALQMPLGIVADRVSRDRLFAVFGVGAVLLSFIPISPWYSAILAGLGNALYHIGGGRESLLAKKDYSSLGIFVAPGAVGIFLGGSLRSSLWGGVSGGLLLALCGLWLLLHLKQTTPIPRQLQKPKGKAVLILLGLFAIVFIRSLTAMTTPTPWKQGLWVAVGALLGAGGKALGGWISDRLSPKWAAAAGILGAFLLLFPQSPVAGVLAGLTVQMSMAITLRDSADLLPGGEGLAFGLLTFALFLGFLPAQLGLSLEPLPGAVLGLLSSLALLILGGRGKKCTT